MRMTMTAALRLLVFVMLMCLVALGCSRQQSDATQAPTPTSHQPSTTLSDPLSEQEVQTFLAVLEALPGNQAPEFEPLSQATASDRLSAAQLVEVYRQEYRAMFDASRHGERWRQSDELMATFARHNITPEDFASLMIRMSCAIAAGAMSPQIELNRICDHADAQVARLVEDITRRDAGPRTQDAVDYRRQAAESLQNSVAYSEFVRILRDVPPASREMVARYHSRLAGHLPQAGTVEGLKRTLDSQIVPTGFEQTPASQPSR
jgi:hypothetical protein